MSDPSDHRQIPEPVATIGIPEIQYDELDVGDRIGTGGDADVYKATVTDGTATRAIALKEPRFQGTLHGDVIQRFRDEAETWSSLDDHDNVVSVHAWDTEPLPWMALEYMDGGNLTDKLGTVDIAEGLWLAGRIADGVRHGHRHGVAHLDLKPDNVLLRETGPDTWDYPKVSDWGLAKMLLEHSKSVQGLSPQYAAPEQFDPDTFGKADDFTDIYQLGAIVYALFTGEPPFSGHATAVM